LRLRYTVLGPDQKTIGFLLAPGGLAAKVLASAISRPESLLDSDSGLVPKYVNPDPEFFFNFGIQILFRLRLPPMQLKFSKLKTQIIA